MALLEVRGLCAGYGLTPVLEDIDLDADGGAVVAVLGVNGAGKTTLLRALDGMIPTRRGSVSLAGRDITRVPTASRARMGIAHVPEGRSLYPRLSVREHLVMGGITMRRSEARTRIAELEERFPLLGRRRGMTIDQLSGGEQQIVAVARSLMVRPQVLLLDEPSAGLAPLIVREVLDIVVSLRQEGTCIILVEQNAPIALDVADRAVVMERGRIALEEDPVVLKGSDRVAARYLARDAGRGTGAGGDEQPALGGLALALTTGAPIAGDSLTEAGAPAAGDDAMPTATIELPVAHHAGGPGDESLRIRDIEVSFGGNAVLRAVSCSVEPGLVTALIGPNGAGKTTVLNAISGFIRVIAGEITFGGGSLLRRRPPAIARLGIGRTFQSGQVFGELTVHDNLLGAYGLRSFGAMWSEFVGSAGGRRGRRQADDAVHAMATRLGLEAALHRRAGDLSVGAQKIVDLGRALIGDPLVLLADEPVAGLSGPERKTVASLLADHAARGRCVLLIEHDMEFIMNVSDRIYVLNFGEVIATGSPDEIRNDSRVVAAYLGEAVA